jgi:hypothetical protein
MLGLIYLQLGNRNSAMEQHKILRDLDKDKAKKLLNFINK